MRRSVGQQTNLVDTQIRQYLPTQSYLTQCPLTLLFVVLFRSLLAVQSDSMRRDTPIDPEPSTSIVQVDQSAAPCFSDHLQRSCDHLAAVT